MGKCVTCGSFLGPNFCIVVNETKNHLKCVFCHLGKNYITVEAKDGSEHKVTKEEAKKKYKDYIDDLHRSKNIQKVINPSRIIMP